MPSFGARDAVALAIVLALAFLMMARVGSRRGVELMPWPDGLEYAAQAVNLDAGRGAVLHFGGYSYPSRYPEGYPLILAAALPLIGHDVARLYAVTIAIGLCAIVAIYLLALKTFGRPSAIIAAVLLALCPVFLTYSTLVLSDVPTMAVTMLAAYALAAATEEEGSASRTTALYASWAIFGLIAGFSAMMRPTNASIVVAFAVCIVMVPPAGLSFRQMVAAAAAFAAAFVLMPLVQLHANWVHLGGPLRNGYGWWVPEIYSGAQLSFSFAHLFGPTMPRNPHGNVPIYAAALMGLDGLFGDPGDPRYFLYPFAAAVFAIVGIVATIRGGANRVARRIVWFGVVLLALLFAVYMFDLFTETAYLLPGVFIMLIAAGYGAVVANRRMRETFDARRRSGPMIATAGAVAVLDLMLVIALATEFSIRISATPRESRMVEALAQVEGAISPKATIVSNISLQFLELYIPGDSRQMVGLNSLDPGETFTDYHLHRLFAKRALGWKGPVPPVLFADDAMTPSVQNALLADTKNAAGAYLLLAAPESQEYSGTLRDEIDRMNDAFGMEPIIRNQTIALFKLAPRE